MEAGAAQQTLRSLKTISGWLSFLVVILIFSSCHRKPKWTQVDPGFSTYVDAYTTGVVSRKTPIRIQLAASLKTVHTVGEETSLNLFDITPSVKGKTFWVDATTVEFRPEKELEPNEIYDVSFRLGKVAEVPSKFRDFNFSLQTLKPSFTVKNTGLRTAATSGIMQLTGELETADREDAAAVEKLIQVEQDGNSLSVSWQHNDQARLHTYTISNVKRTSQTGTLSMRWNGKPLHIDYEGFKEMEIPAAGDFKVLDIVAVNDIQQYASVRFSDAIASGQDLTGLITISNQYDLSYTITGGEIKVFTNTRLEGSYTVTVAPGIKNTKGDVLAKGITANLNFENRLPSVKIFGKGTILPNSGRLVLPFDATNLNAIDVSILRIYETNVPRFLQENNLDGEESLRRVARPVVQQTIRLDADKSIDLHKKQRFSLDIDKYLKTEPGAIYRVTIGFRPEYSVFNAAADTARKSTKIKKDDEEESDEEGDDEGYYYSYNREGESGVDADEDFWRRYDSYYPFGYNWRKRDDPTHRSYYNKDRWASRNIMASNIGVTAKRGAYNRVFVAVNNLLTTDPMEAVDLELLDYQQMIVGKGSSDKEGFAELNASRKPYLLIARKGAERSYLRIDDGSALPLSRFDVGGAEIKNGIKGFIYGERGVWRPGDTLFLNCIIEDREKKLPAEHPVEFSLLTPQGQVYKTSVQAGVKDGFYLFKTVTDPGAPTGNWLARIKCGGAIFEKRIRIETVMPNRLKINLDFGADPLLGPGGTNEGHLQATWLFGAPGKNLKAKIDASFYARKTSFSKFAGYVFDNPAAGYSTQSKTIFDGTLDANGDALLKTGFESEEVAPGMLTASLAIKVFEPGGSFSIDQVSLPYSPFSTYAGLKLPQGEGTFDYLLTGKTHTAQIANADSRGNAVTGNSSVEVQFYKIQWRWWWDDAGYISSNFAQDVYNKLIRKETVQLQNGKGSFQFGVGPRDWGRYLILVKDLKSGHVAGSAFYLDEPGWQSREGGEDKTAASMLSFTSNREQYQVGDEIALTIPSSAGGRMLVSLENGSRILRRFWQETQPGQTIVKFKADAEMAPNIYATVSLIQPHAQTINDLPIRMYGSLPLFIEDKNTRLKPQLSMASVIKPEQPVSFSVSEENGREMSYSVAIVDEGLLDLTRFKTPDPYNSFYAREALGVKTFDIYDYVIGAFAGGMDRILTIGGDADGGPSRQKTANRFKPVVKYFGPFHLNKGQTKQHQFTLPAYMGAVRVMVVAAHEGSYGSTEKSVNVKKPLMLFATVPRVLGPGESIRLPVTVFAMDASIKQVNLQLQTNNGLMVSGASSQQISITQPGEQMAYFDIAVKPVTGIAKLKLTASSGSEKASYEVEVDVRNPNPPVTQVKEMQLAPGQQWKITADALGIASSSTAVLELSSVPAMNLQKRLDYLIEYPHGCVEQTTSAVFPQLVLNQLTELDDYQRSLVERNIRAAITRLTNFQRPDGGLGYWPGAPTSDEWGTSYAGHFLIEAKRAGYAVNDALLQQWMGFQKARANSWEPSTTQFYGTDLQQAYRLYTLALAKSPETGAMNRLREFNYLSPEAKWRLAAAYQLSGQDAVAASLVSGLPSIFTERKSPGYTFGSALRDEAMVLETLTLMGKRLQAEPLLNSIAARLSKDTWYSTQTTSYCLLAIAQYCGKNPSAAPIMARLEAGTKPVNLKSGSYLIQQNIDVKKGPVNLVLTNQGTNQLFVRLIRHGQPVSGDSIPAISKPNVLTMNVTYQTQDGQPFDIAQIPQGKDFVAKVVIKNTGRKGYYDQMALSQIFPSGWEILNARMMGGEGALQSSSSTYQDIRDDRVYTYFGIAENEVKTFYIQLNATYPGRYYLPGTLVEAMYDRSMAGSVPGRWVQVVP